MASGSRFWEVILKVVDWKEVVQSQSTPRQADRQAVVQRVKHTQKPRHPDRQTGGREVPSSRTDTFHNRNSTINPFQKPATQTEFTVKPTPIPF